MARRARYLTERPWRDMLPVPRQGRFPLIQMRGHPHKVIITHASGGEIAAAIPTGGGGGGGCNSFPTFNPATDTQVFPIGLTTPETFESYVDNTAFRAAYILHETFGTVLLNTGSVMNGQKCFEADFNAVGCLPGTDSNVGIEKGNLTDYLNAYKNYYIQWTAQYSSGFKFTDPNNCAGATAMKTVIFFREENNQGYGRITFSAQHLSGGDACPNPFGVVTPTNPDIWAVTFATTQTSQQAASCVPAGKATYAQHLNVATKRPDMLADGISHVFKLAIRKESIEDFGDGLVSLCIDDVPVMLYDGKDATSPAFGIVYTRALGIGKTYQLYGILNRGANTSVPQTARADDIRIWHDSVYGPVSPQ